MYDDEPYVPSSSKSPRYCCHCKLGYPCDYASECRLVPGKPHFVSKGPARHCDQKNSDYTGGRHKIVRGRTSKYSKVGNPV